MALHPLQMGKGCNCLHDNDKQSGTSTDPVGLAIALRDFFLAGSGDELARSLAALPGLAALPPDAISELEFEYNRLFTGPMPPQAPPYASVYLEKEPRLMGETTRQIARFYEALGLSVAIAGLPADFLALELEAWLVLASNACDSRAANRDIEQARQFLWSHLNTWLPHFTDRMRRVPLSPLMARIADLLDEWLAAAKEDTWQKD